MAWSASVERDNPSTPPGFGGSFSIKTVLPALVPEARGWAGLEVKDGEAAAGVLEGMLVRGVEASREELMLYCEADTEEMVGVWGWLSHGRRKGCKEIAG
jgi:hypothetical protein